MTSIIKTFKFTSHVSKDSFSLKFYTLLEAVGFFLLVS